MKKLLFVSFLFLISCTNGSNSPTGAESTETPKPSSPMDEKEVSLSKLISLSSDIEAVGDFDDNIEMIYNAETKDLGRVIRLRNPTEEAKALDIEILNNSQMAVAYNRCPAVLGAGENCSLMVVHRLRYVPNGTHMGFLKLMAPDVGISIVSEISNSSYVPPTSDGDVAHDIDMTGINFDNYIPGERMNQEIIITNTSSSKTVGGIAYGIPEGYNVLLNRCGDSIKPGRTCSIILQFTGHTGTPNIDDAFVVTNNGNSIKQDDMMTKPTLTSFGLLPNKAGFSVSGTGLAKVKKVSVVDGSTVLGVLSISQQSDTGLQLKPASANMVLTSNKSYIIRME